MKSFQSFVLASSLVLLPIAVSAAEETEVKPSPYKQKATTQSTKIKAKETTLVKKAKASQEPVDPAIVAEANKSAKEIIKSNDLDENGKLSKDEVDTIFRVKRFDKVDTNTDGFLDEEELTISYKNAALAQAQRGESNSPLTKVKNSVGSFVGGIADEVSEVGN